MEDNQSSKLAERTADEGNKFQLFLEVVLEHGHQPTIHRFWHEGNDTTAKPYASESGTSRDIRVDLDLEHFRSALTDPTHSGCGSLSSGDGDSYLVTLLVIDDGTDMWVSELFDEWTLDIWDGVPEFFVEAAARARASGDKWAITHMDLGSANVRSAFDPKVITFPATETHRKS